MKKLIAILLCLVMVVSMVACGGEKNPPPTDEKVITIGVFEPTSGQNGAGGKKEILGIQYANSLYPTVTIGGEEYKIELTYADNQSDSSKAPTAAQQLVSKGVTAVLGTYGSSCAIAGGPYFEQAKIPAIGTSCTNPQVTQGNDYYFRVCFIDPFQGEKMAAFAAEVLGVKTAAVFAQTGNDYAQGLADAFKAKCAEFGVEIVAEEGYAKGDVDYKSQLTNIAAKNPEVVFCPNYYEDDGLIVTQARQVGVTGTFLGGDGWSGVKNYASADVLEGSYYCSGYAPASTDAVKQFEEEFVAAYGKDTLNMFAATAYDAAMIMCAALEKAEETGYAPASEEYKQAVIDAIRTEGPNVKGITSEGGYTFDEYNNPIKDAVIIKVTGGEEVFDRMF